MKRLTAGLIAGGVALVCAVSVPHVVLAESDAAAQDAEPQRLGPDAEMLAGMRQQAIGFLRTTQADDGSWTTPTAPGIVGLVTRSLLDSGLSDRDPMVANALKHMQGFVQEDGGIYFPGSNHRNYETCISLMVFHAVNHDGRYDKVISGAQKFLRELQWDQGEGLESADAGFGGAGYGSHQRPDASNTQFFIEALRTSGIPEDDEAIQKALIFMSRCQNLETEFNTTPFSTKVNDGGFYYTPAAGGTSQAGLTDNGGLRSYGSMTYAGLKSMIYAGVDEDDPRVKAAIAWIQRHYTVRENPGMGHQGLYYYYHTFAKALDTLNQDEFADAAGDRHDWRNELAEQLRDLQQSNGSWVNRAERWYEGDPNLATAYALLALKYCEPKTVSKTPVPAE